MPKKPETLLAEKIVKALNSKLGGYWVNIHGSPFQSRGIPDITGCYNGVYIGIEVKMPGKGNTLSKYQELNIKKINEAGGRATMVESVNEALNFVKEGRK